ncbi:hypothetical protein AGLY_015020 [Aphis glycines]|uniref:Uncharacterized protein n=1 Tax=Aphis glycines TaxID=307491 RepID=A0A6G0T2U5_APHGL|nr:hypothetical protein AGLY_015020 [Aphis glycines]
MYMMAAVPRKSRLNPQTMNSDLISVQNGLINIYQIDNRIDYLRFYIMKVALITKNNTYVLYMNNVKINQLIHLDYNIKPKSYVSKFRISWGTYLERLKPLLECYHINPDVKIEKCVIGKIKKKSPDERLNNQQLKLGAMSTTAASAPEDTAPFTAVALKSMITATNELHPE